MQTSKVHARDLAGVPQRWGRSPRPESAPARSRSPPSRDLAAQMTSPTAAAQRHPSPENSRYPCTDRSARSTPEVRSWGQSVTSPVGAAAHPGAMPVTSEYHESRQRSSVPIQETHSRRKPSDKTGAGTQQSSTATAAVGSPGSWGQDAWGTPTKTSGALDGMASFAAKEALLTQHEDRGRLLKTCKGFQELGFRPKNFEELCEEDSLEDKLPRFDMEYLRKCSLARLREHCGEYGIPRTGTVQPHEPISDTLCCHELPALVKAFPDSLEVAELVQRLAVQPTEEIRFREETRRLIHGSRKGFGWGTGQSEYLLEGIVPGGPFHRYMPENVTLELLESEIMFRRRMKELAAGDLGEGNARIGEDFVVDEHVIRTSKGPSKRRGDVASRTINKKLIPAIPTPPQAFTGELMPSDEDVKGERSDRLSDSDENQREDLLGLGSDLDATETRTMLSSTWGGGRSRAKGKKQVKQDSDDEGDDACESSSEESRPRVGDVRMDKTTKHLLEWFKEEDKREWFKDSSKEEDTRRLVLEAWNNVSSLNESTSPLPSHDSSSFDDLWESSEVRPKLKRKKPPPGLVYTRDINPNYRPGSFDKFMIDPVILKEGGERLDKAVKMLELMQHPDCSDLWEDTASDQEEEVADGTRFGEMVREWHEMAEADPEGTHEREREAWEKVQEASRVFAESHSGGLLESALLACLVNLQSMFYWTVGEQESLVQPILDVHTTYVDSPEVQQRYEASVRGEPGAITFVDGQPIYPPARDVPPDYPRGAIPPFNLTDALRNRVTPEENLQVFKEKMQEMYNSDNLDIFEPWREEMPPVESIPDEWMADVMVDAELNERGLPGVMCKMTDPWLQRWWLGAQAERILEACCLEYDAVLDRVVPSRRAGPGANLTLSPDVDPSYVQAQLGIPSLAAFLAATPETDPRPTLSFAQLFCQLRPTFLEAQVDYEATTPNASDLVVPDDLATVVSQRCTAPHGAAAAEGHALGAAQEDAIKYALLEQGGDLGDLTTPLWDEPTPPPPVIQPGSTLAPPPKLFASSIDKQRSHNAATPSKGSKGNGSAAEGALGTPTDLEPSSSSSSDEAAKWKRLQANGGEYSRGDVVGGEWKKGSWFNDDTAGEDGSESQDSEYDDTFKKSKLHPTLCGFPDIEASDASQEGDSSGAGAWGDGPAGGGSSVKEAEETLLRSAKDARRDEWDRGEGWQGFAAHPKGGADPSQRWRMVQRSREQPGSASAGGPNCVVSVDPPPGIYFYPPSQIFVRRGDFVWHHCQVVPNLCWLHIIGQSSLRTHLWGMWMLRPFSRGTLGGLFMCYLTKTSFEVTLCVQGGPWKLDQCDVRSSSDVPSTAIMTVFRSDLTLSESALGGLEPIKLRRKKRLDTGETEEFWGEANGGLVCLDDSWCVLLGCTVDQTGEGAAAVRFSEYSGGLMESCLVQDNDLGVVVDDSARVAVYSSLFQNNRQGAFYAAPSVGPDSEVELVDNTICASSCLDFDLYGCWSSSRRPPNLIQCDNRENW